MAAPRQARRNPLPIGIQLHPQNVNPRSRFRGRDVGARHRSSRAVCVAGTALALSGKMTCSRIFRLGLDRRSLRARSASPNRGFADIAAFRFALTIAIATGITLCVAVAAGASAEIRWEETRNRAAAGESIVAQALSPRGGHAFATASRVVWSGASGRGVDANGAAEVVSIKGTRELAFDAEGRLWLGTDAGLLVWRAGDRPLRKSLPGAKAEERVLCLVSDGHAILVTTTAGAYWSSGGFIFQRLSGGGLAEAVRFAVQRGEGPSLREGPIDIWHYGDRGLTRISGRIAPAGVRITARRTLDLPRPRSEREVVGLALDSAQNRLLIAYQDALAHRAISDTVGAAEALVRSPSWRIERPSLGAGNTIRDVAFVGDRIVVATKAGIFEADQVEGPFRRTMTSGISGECTSLSQTRGGDVVAACGSRLWRRRVGPPPPTTPSRLDQAASPDDEARRFLPADPPVAEIRRRAIKGAGLSRARAADLRRSLWRRGFWPDVNVGIEADFDRDDRRFLDQSFVSGDYRHLSDRTRDLHSGYRATLDFKWKLGETVYPEDVVDLSREQRQVTSLRDDVTDEIHQLYFERQKIRARLLAGPPFELGEPTRLRLRAAELAAGLDAWTDGWLRQWHRDRSATAAHPQSFPPTITAPNSREEEP